MSRQRQWSRKLAYDTAGEMLFGSAIHPVTAGSDVVIGGGRVIAEVNFTLPPMSITPDSFPEARRLFRDMATKALERSVRMEEADVVLELEHVFELTERPEWGATITADIKEAMADIEAREGLKSALRVTVADIREQERPPRMRTGDRIERVMEAFAQCAEAGADILSIESVGGKELYDQALMYGDVEAIVYALGVLACRDMEQLWGRIVNVAETHATIPGGDTDCAHANTAMHLAHQGMMPKTLAALVRLLGGVRSLVACEMGAVGPLKDCGYENPMVKAITGVPISMEGKSSACAHSSPVGNIAAAACDLWSNESVQHVKLLGGFAPEVFTEILAYDARLMNEALKRDEGERLRDLFVASDLKGDPQAWAMSPNVMFDAARTIVHATPPDGACAETDYRRTVEVARNAMEGLRRAIQRGEVRCKKAENGWLNRISQALDELPESSDELGERVVKNHPDLFLPEAYGMDARATQPA